MLTAVWLQQSTLFRVVATETGCKMKRERAVLPFHDTVALLRDRGGHDLHLPHAHLCSCSAFFSHPFFSERMR